MRDRSRKSPSVKPVGEARGMSPKAPPSPLACSLTGAPTGWWTPLGPGALEKKYNSQSARTSTVEEGE